MPIPTTLGRIAQNTVGWGLMLILLSGCRMAAEKTANAVPDYKLLTYQGQDFYVIDIPPGTLKVTPHVFEGVGLVETLAQNPNILGAVNAGYFDPANAKTTSFVVLNGKTVLDPATNERLMNNPTLSKYMPLIKDRSEFRVYQCGKAFTYDITRHTAPIPTGCKLTDSLGAGPQLLPQRTDEAEGFVDPATKRDPIGVNHINARSAVGIFPDGRIQLVMVAQKPGGTGGVSLSRMADYFKQAGASKALNLDGGSSSSMLYNGQAVYGKYNPKRTQPLKRPVKSTLIVSPVEAP